MNDVDRDDYVEYLEEIAKSIQEDEALIEDAISECTWRYKNELA